MLTPRNIAVSIVILALFAPIMVQFGFNEVWFGILFMVQMQIAYISPPFGYSIFYLYAVAPRGIGLVDMYKASLPFMGMQVIGLAIFIIWPSSILWLPNILMK